MDCQETPRTVTFPFNKEEYMLTIPKLFQELFLYNPTNTFQDLSNVPYEQNQQLFYPTGKESKNYFREYVKAALEKNIKVKRMNFWIAAPLISREVLEFTTYWNIAIKKINNIDCVLHVLSYEQLINYIISYIPSECWYIADSPPAICVSKEQVFNLCNDNQALLIQ